MFMLWSSMTRVSPTGIVSGASERVDAYAAPQALTTGPAWQAFEEERTGRIPAGLLADFVILDRNTLSNPVDVIRAIKVREPQLGRTSGRTRGCTYVYNQGGDGCINTKKTNN